MMHPGDKGAMVYQLEGQTMHLLPEKAVYWEEQKMLIVADVHLGKAGYFRKASIPVPAAVHWHDLQVLSSLLTMHQPGRVLLLGDLFHSTLNNEWWDFENLLEHFSEVQFLLVKGNHDMLPDAAYRWANIEVYTEGFFLYPFIFLHIPPEKGTHQDGYYLSGHIHPAVRIGKGWQSEKLPCFHFRPEGGILPAFGRFTGFVSVKKQKNDRVFAVLPPSKGSGKVIALP